MGESKNSNIIWKCVATVFGHDAAVSCIVSAGDYLYTASLGNDIRMWELPDLTPCAQLRAPATDRMCAIKAMLITKGSRLMAAHQDQKIRVWRCHKPTQHRLIATLPSFTECLWKGLWQRKYVKVRRHRKSLWIQHADTISALALRTTPAGEQVLYSASWDKTVKVWRMSDLTCVESISAHDDAVNALAACPQSGIVYTASADGKVKAWGKAVGAKRHRLRATLAGVHQKGASVNALALSESGEFLFSAGSDGAVAVWGRKKGQEHVISKLLHKITGCHAQPILCLCICKLQEGELLLSGSADKTVRVWRIDAHNGGNIACVGVLQGHMGAVKSICVVSNNDHVKMVAGRGCLVYTGSVDKSIKAWWVSAALGKHSHGGGERHSISVGYDS